MLQVVSEKNNHYEVYAFYLKMKKVPLVCGFYEVVKIFMYRFFCGFYFHFFCVKIYSGVTGSYIKGMFIF